VVGWEQSRWESSRSNKDGGLVFGRVSDGNRCGGGVVLLTWQNYDRVALDSQGVIQRVWNLQYVQLQSWVGGVLAE